jgi:hypothetical protein
MMVLDVDPKLAGALAVAVAEFRRRYSQSGVTMPEGLAELQELFTKVATDGQGRTSFDLAEWVSDAARMKPLAVTFETAGALLGYSERTIRRKVANGELATIGSGPATRVVVASIDEYVTRNASRDAA